MVRCNNAPGKRRPGILADSLALLALSLAASPAAGYKTVTLQDSPAALELRLHFDSIAPGSRQLEYSGDYQAKKGPFRIFAQERFLIEAGDYRGWAEDHLLEKKTPEDQPGFPHLEEQSFHAQLINPAGDTLSLATGAVTSMWHVGLELYRDYRMQDGRRESGGVSISALERLERVFPDLPTPVSLRQGSRTDLRILSAGKSLELEIPPNASRVEIYNLAGERLHSERVLPGTHQSITPSVRESGIHYIRFL